jgi:hypothetical protein
LMHSFAVYPLLRSLGNRLVKKDNANLKIRTCFGMG